MFSRVRREEKDVNNRVISLYLSADVVIMGTCM